MKTTPQIAPQTLDQVAVALMVSDLPQAAKQLLLREMADRVTREVNFCHECPSCGSTNPKENNELPSNHYECSLLCLDCGESWSPNAD